MKIVFFGDSITEGCFEVLSVNGKVEVLRDKPHGYVAVLEDKIRKDFPDMPLEVVNAGISGNATADGIARFEEAVLSQNPDLVVLCFGLNDVYYRDENRFGENMRVMLSALKERKIPTVVMTPNMMNKYVSSEVPNELLETAKDCAECQNTGVLDRYAARALALAEEYGFYTCDAYGFWKRLERYGVDTTALLCNKINHPTRKMQILFADMLYRTLTEKGLL